jgi:hypothetical protein
MSYSQIMSQMRINLTVGTSSIQYEAPRASSYDTPDSSTRVFDTQAPQVQRHNHSRREIQLRDTYNPSLIRIMSNWHR